FKTLYCIYETSGRRGSVSRRQIESTSYVTRYPSVALASTRSSDSGAIWTGPLNGWSNEIMTTRPDVRRIDKIAVIASCASSLRLPKNSEKKTVKAHPSGQGQIVDLGEDLRHVGGAARARPIQRHGRAIERIQSVRRLGVLRVGLHGRPVLLDREPQIIDEAVVELGGLGLRALGVVKQRGCCSGFSRDRGLPLAEFLPDGDHDKRKQHGIDHANGREHEACDLVVEFKPIDADPAADEHLENDRDGRRDEDDRKDQRPERKNRQYV